LSILVIAERKAVSVFNLAFDFRFSAETIFPLASKIVLNIRQSGSTPILMHLLKDLHIQNPKRTKTYFRLIADFLNTYLKDVRLQPVVVVIFDGISDGLNNDGKSVKNLKFQEITFERFGKRGIYSALGISGWKIAIDGGKDLDLGILLSQKEKF